MVEALEPFTLYETGPAEATASRWPWRTGCRTSSGRSRGRTARSAAPPARPRPPVGIPAITAEAGECGLVQEQAVAAHVRGLDRVLATLGMADSPAAAAASRRRT